MATLAEEIAKHAHATYRGTTEPEKVFLRRWTKNIVDRPLVWKRIEKKITDPFWLVEKAIQSWRIAQLDHAHGEDAMLRGDPEFVKEVADLAEAATKLFYHYKRTQEQIADIRRAGIGADHQRVEELVKASALLMEDQDVRFYLISTVDPQPLVHTVHVGNQGADRERRMFVQRMSLAMKDKWDEWHDAAVAEITSLVYPKVKKVKDLVKAVTKQRNKLFESTTPFPAKKP
jgi:hypothetical protein